MRWIILCIICFFGKASIAQRDTSNSALNAYIKSITSQDYLILEPHLSPSFKIGDYNKTIASQIIPQIYQQYPSLETVEWTNESDRQYMVTYDFSGIPPQSSKVIIDDSGKIVKIELFDDILSQSDTREENSNQEDQISLDSIPFPSKKQIKGFYNTIIREIELLDAEGIDTRNRKKDVTWNQYVKKRRAGFIKASNWDELATQFEIFGKGFVNLHSHFKREQNASSKTNKKNTDLTIGFTYPEISFFNLKSKKTITHLNNTPIEDIYYHFSNFDCAHNSGTGCLNSFCKRLKSPYTLKNGDLISSVSYEDGSTQQIVTTVDTSFTSKDPYATYLSSVDTSRYPDWEWVASGYKVALFKKEDIALIRIKDFLYFKGMGGDIRCAETAPDSTMCGDIRLLRKALSKINVQHLIFDVQNNGGGNENSAFIAEFSMGPFYDLAVQFRKTKMLEDGKFRNTLFYGSNMSENWYRSISDSNTYKDTKYGDFLPIRADFCQGDSHCLLSPIEPNLNHRKIDHIYILTNHGCVSSCDDFVWRMQQYSSAKVVGLEHAADATYSRIGVVFYIDKNGKIGVHYEGGNRKFPLDGTRFAKMTIPYSKTVKHDGSMRQGVSAQLDLLIPVTKDNYQNHNKMALDVLVDSIKTGKWH